MGPASRKGKPQFCKLCVDAQGGRVPMKGHKLQCPARAAQLTDVSVPLSTTPSSPPNVNAPGSPSSLHTPSTMTTPSPSPATSPMNDHMGSPICPVDTSTLFDLNDILNDLHTLIPTLHDNFTFPASSPSPYTPTNLTLNPPTDLLTPPSSGFFTGETAAEPPMTAGADLDGLAAMDWDDDVDPPALTPYDFGQFFNIVTPPSTLSERDIHTDGDAHTQTMVTDFDVDPGQGVREHAQDYQFPSPVTGGDAALAAPSEPNGGFAMHGDYVSASVESVSTRDMDGRPPDASMQVRPPTSRAPSLRAAGVRKFSATAITDRKKISKQYAFLHKVQRRKNEHSRMAANILKQICALDQKTAPFILAFIARPESILDGQGRIHSYMSENLRRILGDALLEEIHQKIMDYCHQQTGRQVEMAIDINFQAERAKRVQAEEELAVMQREVAQLRAMVQATPVVAVM